MRPTVIVIDKGQLRVRARQRMADGVLPSRRAVDAAGFRASGETCALCGAPISQGTTAVAVPNAPHGPATTLHLDCFHIWDAVIVRDISQD